jgi:hypothetical protein
LPTELLLPAFVVTLVANAILIVAAVRALRPGTSGPDRPFTRTDAASRPALGAGSREREIQIAGRRAVEPTPPGPAASAVDPGASGASDEQAAPVSTAVLPSPATPERPAEPDDAPRTARRRPTRPAGRTSSDVSPAGAPPTEPATSATPAPDPAAEPPPERAAGTRGLPKPTTANGTRRRRRFALPPLDDDHERVRRSIATFLAGADPSAEAAGPDVPAPVERASADAAGGAVTVALAALVGTETGPADAERSGTDPDPERSPAGDADSAHDLLERTLRGAARGSDVVTVEAPGRFRIVLPESGEMAARAYLRRVRATVDPALESTDTSLRLVVATATVLGRPVREAADLADRRMAAVSGPTTAPGSGATPAEAGSPGSSASPSVADRPA